MITPAKPTFTLLLGLALCSITLAAPDRTEVICTRQPAKTTETLPNGNLLIDFGDAMFGNVEILDPKLTQPTKLTLHLGEARTPDGVNRHPGGTVRYQQHTVSLQPGKPASPTLTWAPPGWLKDGFITIPKGQEQVMPFRYLEVENPPPSLDAKDFTRKAYTVPFDENASHFTSSNPELDSVWQLCKHTIRATTFLGIYIDGDRERRPYEGDILINQLSHYCTDAHYETTRHSFDFILDHPTWPTEWHFQTIIIAWNDFLWSGDDTLIRNNYQKLKKHLLLNDRTPDGLFKNTSTYYQDIIDWPACERDSYDMSMPIKTVVTAYHHHALTLMAKIATHLGKPDDAKKFTTLADETLAAFNTTFWSPGQHLYIDGTGANGKDPSPHASAHANFFPLALGLVPDDRIPAVTGFLKTKGMPCSVYGAQFLLEALYDHGEPQAATDLITSHELRSWHNMVEKTGTTLTLEAWDPSLKPNLDWNHPWGTAPANILPRKLLGIEPLKPGFTLFRARPQLGTLTQATIKTPTPKGPITLAIQNPATGPFTAEINIPKGTACEFHLPHPSPPPSLETKAPPNHEYYAMKTATPSSPCSPENGKSPSKSSANGIAAGTSSHSPS